ncbi:MAG: hypothetical protein ACLR8Y_07970 [Alistipes indistinctus]
MTAPTIAGDLTFSPPTGHAHERKGGEPVRLDPAAGQGRAAAPGLRREGKDNGHIAARRREPRRGGDRPAVETVSNGSEPPAPWDGGDFTGAAPVDPGRSANARPTTISFDGRSLAAASGATTENISGQPADGSRKLRVSPARRTAS